MKYHFSQHFAAPAAATILFLFVLLIASGWQDKPQNRAEATSESISAIESLGAMNTRVDLTGKQELAGKQDLLATNSFFSEEVSVQTGSISGFVELGPARITQVASGPQNRYRRPAPTSSERTEARAESRPILVWIEGQGGGEGRLDGGATAPPVLDQVELQFNPRLIGVVTGGRVRVINSDPVYHNVFSLSSVKRFDIGRRPTGEHVDLTFEQPGIVQVFCDIHPHMNATIVVMSAETVDSVVISDPSAFSFTGLPAGTYRLHVFASGYHQHSATFTVQSGQELRLANIRLEAS